MFSYWIYDASVSVPNNLSAAYEKARMRPSQRKVKDDEKFEVKRPCQLDSYPSPNGEGEKPVTCPPLKINKVFRLRAEHARREANRLVRQRENAWNAGHDYRKPKLANRSSSYILQAPSVAGVPYIPTASHRHKSCTDTIQGLNKLDVITALTWKAWTDIKTRLHMVIQPLINMLSFRKRADKCTSTSEDTETHVPPVHHDLPGPRVDSWQKGRPKTLKGTSFPWGSRALSRPQKRIGPSTANIAKVTRDPKTKVVTVWTVEKKLPSPKAAASRPGPRPWRF